MRLVDELVEPRLVCRVPIDSLYMRRSTMREDSITGVGNERLAFCPTTLLSCLCKQKSPQSTLTQEIILAGRFQDDAGEAESAFGRTYSTSSHRYGKHDYKITGVLYSSGQSRSVFSA